MAARFSLVGGYCHVYIVLVVNFTFNDTINVDKKVETKNPVSLLDLQITVTPTTFNK
jgi:hypothetical protein